MLVVTRKLGEEVVIGEGIRVTLVAIEGKRVRLGILAPPDVSIRRAELPPVPAARGGRAAAPARGRRLRT
jgi:carbon storage regulator